METTEATGRVFVARVPEGEAPLTIREAWVGLTLPCLPIIGYSSDTRDRGVLTNQELPRNRYCASVPQEEALKILETHRPDAAQWWRDHGYPKSGEYFGFSEWEVSAVSGVRFQRVVLVPEEMTCDVHR